MREEIVERVKNELSKHIRVDAAGLSPAVVQHFVLGLDEAAQAAITATLEALREPTPGMMEAAGGECVNLERADDPSYEPRDIWSAMLNQLRKEVEG